MDLEQELYSIVKASSAMPQAGSLTMIILPTNTDLSARTIFSRTS
jgi:hypothetical protein